RAMEGTKQHRRLPVGAEPTAEGVHFRVWAPKRRRGGVVLEGGAGAGAGVELAREADGYHSGLVAPARPGTLYRFRLDGDRYLYPDPVSRFQADGPHGPSRVVDPTAFTWTDGGWRGVGVR